MNPNTLRELQPYIQRTANAIVQAWQQSGLTAIAEALREQERIEQRQRITAAKRRARIVTRAKAAKGSKSND